MIRPLTLHHAPLLRMAIAMIVGMIIGYHFPWTKSSWCWLGGAMVCSCCGLLAFRRQVYLQGGMICFAALLLGTGVMLYRRGSISPLEYANPLRYDALVSRVTLSDEKKIHVDLTVFQLGNHRLDHPFDVRATFFSSAHLATPVYPDAGQVIRVSSRLGWPTASTVQSTFDYAAWLRVHGYRSVTSIQPSQWQMISVNEKNLPWTLRWRRRLSDFRGSLLAVYQRYGLTGTHYGVLSAMTLGDKSQLSPHTRQLYVQAGAAHVLALSGLHMSIIYGLLLLFLGGLCRHRWIVHGVIVLSVWGFVLLVGCPLSAMRAACMLSLFSLCQVLQRRHATLNTLSFAACVMLLLRPMSLFDVGFELSFMAVLGIVLYVPPLMKLLRLHHPFSKAIWSVTVVTFSAQLVTFPLVGYYFGMIPCYGLLTNMVAIPAVTLLLYLALTLLFLSPWMMVASWLAKLIGLLIDGLDWFLRHVALLPGACWSTSHWHPWTVCLLYLFLFSMSVVGSYVLRLSDKVDVRQSTTRND